MDWPLNRIRLGAIAGSLGILFILMASFLPCYAAAAAEPATTAPAAAKRFATVWRIRGDVFASGGNTKKERQLHEGDPVYVGERVRANALSEATLKTEDAGVVAVRPSTEFVAESFSAQDKPTDNFNMRIVSGSLRVISGWIAHTNRSGHTITTPSATIGIRGTDHEPYVLPPQLAAATSNPAGTYDKVNRGGTTMQVGENKLDIDTGRVGFVRAAIKQRALMTILLPVLLDKVPSFYVPGEFDAELDLYSQTADAESLRQLEQKRKEPAAPEPQATGSDSQQQQQEQMLAAPAIPEPQTTGSDSQQQERKAPVAAPEPEAAGSNSQQQQEQDHKDSSTVHVAGCEPTDIAKAWLEQLDDAITRHDAAAIVAMFAPEATVRATVRSKDGEMTSVDIGRDELVQSTLAAMKGLKNFSQRRVWTGAKLENSAAGASCDRISLKSMVIEQGLQSGKPYRFESFEKYQLELRNGKWLSISAETTQQ